MYVNIPTSVNESCILLFIFVLTIQPEDTYKKYIAVASILSSLAT